MNEQITQPLNYRTNLYNHQLASIYNMERLEGKHDQQISPMKFINTHFGFLSDITGYGKTATMIGHLCRDYDSSRNEKDTIQLNWNLEFDLAWEKIIGNSYISSRSYEIYKKLPCNLIIVSQSIFGQWEKELQKTNLKIGVVLTRKHTDEIDPNAFDVILCIHTMADFLIRGLNKFAWKRIIIDEPASLKSLNLSKVIAGFIWFITATPYELFLKKRKGLIGEVIPIEEDVFKSIIIKNNDNFVKDSFKMPQTHHIKHNCYNPIQKVLKGLVSEKVLEMVSAGNINGAISALGGDIKTEVNLIELLKNKKIKKLNEVIERSPQNIELKQRIEGQINELETRFKSNLSENCPICYDKRVGPTMATCCQNIFCGECLIMWIKNHKTCPLCRCFVEPENIVNISSDKDLVEFKAPVQARLQTKEEIISELFKTYSNDKFIIFSGHDETFDKIRNILSESKISFGEVKGVAMHREKIIDEYREGKLQVLFLNSLYNSSGIDLKETDQIIIYHEMSEFSKTQIIGRANRIGRKSELKVHYLI